MSDAWLRRAVTLAMVLLVLHAVGSWAYAALGVAAAVASAVLVGVVSVFSARMAGLGKGNDAWFVVPLALFTALPVGAGLWRLYAIEQGWWARSVEFAPVLMGFLAPVLLLLVVYVELGRRSPALARGLRERALAQRADEKQLAEWLEREHKADPIHK